MGSYLTQTEVCLTVCTPSPARPCALQELAQEGEGRPPSLMERLASCWRGSCCCSSSNVDNCATAKGQHLQTLCNLLQRAQNITALTLVISHVAYSPPPQASTIGQVLRCLGYAAGQRLRRLQIVPCSAWGPAITMPLTPQVLQALGAQFPCLTHLTLHRMQIEQQKAVSREQWDAALATLPLSLQALSLALEPHPLGTQALRRAVQAAALRLPQLHSLRLQGKMVGDLSGLAQAVPGAQLPLRHLSLSVNVAVPRLRRALASPLGANLHSLSLQTQDREFNIPVSKTARMLSLLPGLRALTIDMTSTTCHDVAHMPQLLQAVCSLKQLTSLQFDLSLLLDMYTCPSVAPPPAHFVLPQSLRQLRFSLHRSDVFIRSRPMAVAHLLQHGWVPRQCRLVFLSDWRHLLNLVELNCAAAALQHPGGVSLQLITKGLLTQEDEAMEVRGMVQARTGSLPTLLREICCQQQQQQQPQLEGLRALLLHGCGSELEQALCTCAAAGAPGQPMESLEVLAVHPIKLERVGETLEAVARLLSGGWLPDLRHLIFIWQDDDSWWRFKTRKWRAPMRGLLKAAAQRPMQQGKPYLVVQLLPNVRDTDIRSRLRAFRSKLPDPDAVLLGMQGEIHDPDGSWDV